MIGIPDFDQATERFRVFLRREGHPDCLFWVFRDDVWRREQGRVWLRYPPPPENKSLARKVYSEGRERGLVEVVAVAKARTLVAAYVWFPKHPGKEVQGWDSGLKLSISQPLPIAQLAGRFLWKGVERLSGYRLYQQREAFIPSRDWAASWT